MWSCFPSQPLYHSGVCVIELCFVSASVTCSSLYTSRAEMKLLLLVCFAAYAIAEERSATVLLKDPLSPTNVSGSVTFTQTDEGAVTIKGKIYGLKPGVHGFHVHEKGDIAGTTGCLGTAGHFNPGKSEHGGPTDTKRHVGDLGNIIADTNGTAVINFTDSIISLTGDHCIIGRAVVVHADPDDFGKGGHDDSLTTGHAGKRVACGVIGIQKSVSPWKNSAPSMPVTWAWPLAAFVMHFIVEIL